MDKLTLIATAALETKAVRSVEDAIPAIISTFKKEFPKEDLNSWNTEVDNTFAQAWVKEKKGATSIYIKNSILDLWHK